VREAYAKFWQPPPWLQLSDARHSDVIIFIAPAGMLTGGQPASKGTFAGLPRPHLAWVAWSYVRLGETGGLACGARATGLGFAVRTVGAVASIFSLLFFSFSFVQSSAGNFAQNCAAIDRGHSERGCMSQRQFVVISSGWFLPLRRFLSYSA